MRTVKESDWTVFVSRVTDRDVAAVSKADDSEIPKKEEIVE